MPIEIFVIASKEYEPTLKVKFLILFQVVSFLILAKNSCPKQAKDYVGEVNKRLESEAKAEKEIIELHNEIADLCGKLAKVAASDRSEKETVGKISGKIGVFSTKEYSEPDGKHTVYFAGKVGVKREELEKASIAGVRAVIESLEPEHRRYAVLEYVFKNVMEQAIKLAEINL